MNVLLVDHQDSFTHNLVHAFGGLLGHSPEVVDSRVPWERFLARGAAHGLGEVDLLVLGPGPGHPGRPADHGTSPRLLEAAFEHGVPVFGVCFGMQLQVAFLGGAVIEAEAIVHGKSLPVHHAGEDLFEGIPSPALFMRYHSWVADPRTLPHGLQVLGRSDAGEIMAVRHESRPWWGVQFHPESVGSDMGERLLANLLERVRSLA